MTINANSIEEAYVRLSATRAALFNAHEAAMVAEDTYQERRAEIIITTPPKELGANDDQRQAKLVELCAPELKALRETQARERAARLAFELAQDDVKRLDALLRFMAMTALATPPADGHTEELVEF